MHREVLDLIPNQKHSWKKKLLGQLMEIRTDNNIAYIVNFLILIIVLWLSKKCFLFLKNIQNKVFHSQGA